MIRISTTIALFLLLSGCATQYQPNGFSGGYRDMKLSSNSYMVEYNSNAFTDHGTNVKHALRRAAELTKQNGYKYFKVEHVADTSSQYTTPVVANSTENYNSYNNGTYNYYGNGWGTYNGSGTGYGNSSTIVSGGDTYTRPGVAMVITMYKNKKQNCYDAMVVLSNFDGNPN